MSQVFSYALDLRTPNRKAEEAQEQNKSESDACDSWTHLEEALRRALILVQIALLCFWIRCVDEIAAENFY